MRFVDIVDGLLNFVELLGHGRVVRRDPVKQIFCADLMCDLQRIESPHRQSSGRAHMELFQRRIYTGDTVVDPFLIYVPEEDQEEAALLFEGGQVLHNIVEGTNDGSEHRETRLQMDGPVKIFDSGLKVRRDVAIGNKVDNCNRKLMDTLLKALDTLFNYSCILRSMSLGDHAFEIDTCLTSLDDRDSNFDKFR